MMRKTVYYFLFIIPLMVLLMGCSTKKLVVSGVNYQSVRTSFAKPKTIPPEVKIAVEYFFNDNGKVQPVVFNLTDEILTIDQTKSFLVNTDGMSQMYYDPNVYATTEGSFSASTSGSSFNLGAITNALGIGGPIGALAGGTTLSSSTTFGTTRLSTVSIQDQPKITVGPHGAVALGRQFVIKQLGWAGINYNDSFVDSPRKASPIKFAITITYSYGDTDNSERLTTEFYVNSNLTEKVVKNQTSKGMTNIYAKKPDALAEYTYMFLVDDNIPLKETVWYGENPNIETKNAVHKVYMQGSLIDYK